MNITGVGFQPLGLGYFGLLESGLTQKLHLPTVLAFIGDDPKPTMPREFGVFNVSAHGQGQKEHPTSSEWWTRVFSMKKEKKKRGKISKMPSKWNWKNQTANSQEGSYFWPTKYVNCPTFMKLGIIFQKTLDSNVPLWFHYLVTRLNLTCDFQVLFKDWYLKKLQLCFFICHLLISKIP